MTSEDLRRSVLEYVEREVDVWNGTHSPDNQMTPSDIQQLFEDTLRRVENPPTPAQVQEARDTYFPDLQLNRVN